MLWLAFKPRYLHSLANSGRVQYCPVQSGIVQLSIVQSVMVWSSPVFSSIIKYYLVEWYSLVQNSLVQSDIVKYNPVYSCIVKYGITNSVCYSPVQFGIVKNSPKFFQYSPIQSCTRQYSSEQSIDIVSCGLVCCKKSGIVVKSNIQSLLINLSFSLSLVLQ